MTPECNLAALSLAIQANVPTILEGLPGTAKTSLTQALARSLDRVSPTGCTMVTQIASLHDPTTFNGVLSISPETPFAELKPLKWLLELSQAQFGDRLGLIFFDEISDAPDTTRAALLRLIQEGVSGETRLGSRVARIAAMNPPDIANASELLPAMANRFLFIDWTLTLDVWAQAILGDFQDPAVTLLPDGWEQATVPTARGLVVTFLTKRPELFQKLPEDVAQRSRAWPSARSWTNAITLLAAAFAVGASEEVQRTVVAGCVGKGAAREFFAWKDAMDLPDPQEVFAHLETTTFPVRGDQLHAMLNGCLAYALRQGLDTFWDPMWALLVAAHRQTPHVDVLAAVAKRLARAGMKGTSQLQYAPPTEIAAFYKVLRASQVAPAPVGQSHG